MIIFLGIAGSGKSVQSRRLSTALGCEYISVGALLRKNTNLYDKQKMAEGELLDDNLVIDLVAKEIKNIPRGQEFIIDGFPRTLAQTKWIVNESNANPIKVIHITLDPSEVIKRLKLRNRQDDSIEAIRRRIDEYNKFIGPVLEEFKIKDVNVYGVDGSKGLEEVHNQIIEDIKMNEESRT